ncbi:uncharacterized protein [Lepeophtheirus salmonis]|uniref:uncharacterized protein isoform X1 n=1 Tax=Lepeophtheirus salmonis TaxID=72036 RepID=UPI001AE8678B|nr:phospholipase A2, major isoenzyme-like isoform X1 [Lepeophtheirus salmonis]
MLLKMLLLLFLLVIGVEIEGLNYCRDEVHNCEADATSCIKPAYYFKCRRTCGCKGNCQDGDSVCFKIPDRCLSTNGNCYRFCGLCDGCENLIKDELCKELRYLCHVENVKYFCAGTCNKCKYECRNKVAYTAVCNNFKAKGYCKMDNRHSYIIRKICAKACESEYCGGFYDQC